MNFVNFLAFTLVGYLVVDKVLGPTTPSRHTIPDYVSRFFEDGEGYDLEKAREELNEVRLARLEREIKRVDDNFKDIMSAWTGDF